MNFIVVETPESMLAACIFRRFPNSRSNIRVRLYHPEYGVANMTCKTCKVKMKELKGHIFHKQRKWKCPKCNRAKMQTQRSPAKD